MAHKVSTRFVWLGPQSQWLSFVGCWMVYHPWRGRRDHGRYCSRRSNVSNGRAGSRVRHYANALYRIGWPFQADQPSNIAYLTHTADVAFELLEVRTGEHGLNTILATGKKATGTLDAFRVELEKLFNDMKGEPGLRKRANAKRRQADLAMAWTEGGPARVAFQRFCLQYGL